MDLKRRTFEDFSWKPQVNEALATMRHLSLSLPRPLAEFEASKHLQSLADFIATPQDLESLDISYERYPVEYSDSVPIFLKDVTQSRQFWATLQDVKLKGIRAGKQDLVQFLTAHSQTLKRLELVDIVLVTVIHDETASNAQIVPSWIELMKIMQKRLRLQNITFGGAIIAEGSKEFWVVGGPSGRMSCCSAGGFDTGCLKGRVENYIVNGGEWEPTPVRDIEYASPFAREESEFEIGDSSWMFDPTLPT